MWKLALVVALCGCHLTNGAFVSLGSFPSQANDVTVGLQFCQAASATSGKCGVETTYQTNFLAIKSISSAWTPVQLFTHGKLDGSLLWRCALRSSGAKALVSNYYVCETKVTRGAHVGIWTPMHLNEQNYAYQRVAGIGGVDGLFVLRLEHQSLGF
jgi:hypothetical protein